MLGGQAIRNIQIHDISRYEFPGVATRNYAAEVTHSSNEKSPSRLKCEKSMNYGKYALKLFQDSNKNKRKQRDVISEKSPVAGVGAANRHQSYVNKTPGPQFK